MGPSIEGAARALHSAAGLHAMIDISDGLSSDLGHILEESGTVGAILDAGAIPIHADAVEQGLSDGLPPLEHALHDGEDFELCVVLPASDAERLMAAIPAPAQIFRVGEITAEPGVRIRHPDGEVERLEARGFDHFRGLPT